MHTLAKAVDGSWLTRFNEEFQVVLCWYGGYTIIAYQIDGEVMYTFNFHANAKPKPTREQALDAMLRRYSEGWYHEGSV